MLGKGEENPEEPFQTLKIGAHQENKAKKD